MNLSPDTGRNCQWFNEDVSRCEIYGGSYKNFGVTAIEACCACGGGSTAPVSDESGYVASPPLENELGCWDAPDFYDSTGDGCDWYEQGRVQTANTLAGSLQMSAVKMPTLLVAPVVVG